MYHLTCKYSFKIFKSFQSPRAVEKVYERSAEGSVISVSLLEELQVQVLEEECLFLVGLFYWLC